MPDPKSQLNPCSASDSQAYLPHAQQNTKKQTKRSETAKSMRRANRRNKRAERRRKNRELRKCCIAQATRCNSYPVAQECSSKKDSDTSPKHNSMTSTLPEKFRWNNAKIATLNLGGGITHISGRQKIVHTMRVNQLDILALQETRVNTFSTEEHDGYTFYFSTSVTYEQKVEAEKVRQQQKQQEQPTLSEIELYNLDAEKHGVGIAYSSKLRPYKTNVQQINGRLLLATFNTAHVKTNIVVAYAPHAGRSLAEKGTFYRDLQQVLDSLPKYETNIILGDFNVRLMERLNHEQNIMGEHVCRTIDDYIENLNQQQQDNRQRFIDLCQQHDLLVANTLFEKEPAKLITYRNATNPSFAPPYTTDRFGQLDFILINSKWKNAITNAESTSGHSISIDHTLLLANVRIKLAATKALRCQRLPKYRTPTNEELILYNNDICRKIDAETFSEEADPFDIWAKTLIDTAEQCFTAIPPEQKKAYLSQTAWDLLCQKKRHQEQNNVDIVKELEKQIRKQIRQDKKAHMQMQLEEMDAQGYRWSGLKKLRKKYTPKFTKFKDKEGVYVSEKQVPTATAEYLSTAQWKLPESDEEPIFQTLSNIGVTVKLLNSLS